jgi:two-component system, NtrC family, response regulator HydG
MTNNNKILIIDDNEDILLAGKMLLKQHFSLVTTETDPNQIPILLKNESYDVILLDMNFTKDVSSGQEGFFWLSKILEIDPSAVVLLITAYGDIEMAVKAIKMGAIDFVLKPWQNEKLLATISAAINLRKSRAEVDTLRSAKQQLSADLNFKFQNFIGDCPPMREVFATISKVAKTDANILILGENGTGKELVAREIHHQSLRSKEIFISVDVGSLSESLFESELFGYVKGAFTDAREDRAGRFEVASGGTLFLDEIGNLSPQLQSKLLTVLQNRIIYRLGSNIARSIDIRLICATNINIKDMVQQKQFRQDLLYRINTVEINLPPLRDRKNDIPLLVDFFIKIYSKKYKKPINLVHPAALEKMKNYPWYGNVRELQHTVERAIIMSEHEVLQPFDLLLSDIETRTAELEFADLNLDNAERTLIMKALEKNKSNISQAAKELGLTRAALYRRMEKYGL